MRMRPIIKVWPLPEMSEGQLQELAGDIVANLKIYNDLQVETLDDVLIQFPQDMMKLGTGSEVIVEIILPGPPEGQKRFNYFQQTMFVSRRAVQQFFERTFNMEPKITVLVMEVNYQYTM